MNKKVLNGLMLLDYVLSILLLVVMFVFAVTHMIYGVKHMAEQPWLGVTLNSIGVVSLWCTFIWDRLIRLDRG